MAVTTAGVLAAPLTVRSARAGDAKQSRRLYDVNTTDIKDAIRLGCRTMQSVFNEDDPHRVPFFGATMKPPALSFSAHHSESHTPGRHLNALLSAEDAAGIELDEAAVDQHRRAAFFSYGGPLPLPLNRAKLDGSLVNFCPHNIREGFHALVALVRYRNDERAREMAERSIAAIGQLWDPALGWNVERLRKAGLNYQKCQGFIPGEARMLGPLVKYYGATGYGPALTLALVLKEKLVGEIFLPAGDFDEKCFSTTHVHSVTCVLSSLAQLADLLGDMPLLVRVKAFYDKGLWEMRDELGWSPESVGRKTDDGEMNNTGDILETALILGRHGFTSYYGDAERILRGHMLPSQLRDVSWAVEEANPQNKDDRRDVPDRLRGAFGFPAPYGHCAKNTVRPSIGFNLDIVGGTVGSLCEAYRAVTRYDQGIHWVNLLFDHETDAIAVESPYARDGLVITLRKPGPLFVRIPAWVDREKVRITGNSSPPRWTEGRLFFGNQAVGNPITVSFPLAERILTLGAPHSRPIRVRLRGDAVTAMDNHNSSLTFFPPFEETEQTTPSSVLAK
ncbi:MAG: hypothetical protein ACC645_05925 [Pirellulales bacterium]